MALPRTMRAAMATVLMTAAIAVGVTVAAPAAHADGCYTWGRTLSQGASGEDVRQLQIRVAGWGGYRTIVTIDGIFGAGTAAAVRRFQSAYGLGADGIAGPQTFNKIYELQDNDCTPIHFTYAELDNGCGSGYAGGRVSESIARSNALRVMWKLEALRRALGDNPIRVTSGFRSVACNSSVGGASNSQHLYGNSADLGVTGALSLCRMAQVARNHGFSGILGPGYPDHNDHVHLDLRGENNDDGVTNGWSWAAPSCGVSAAAGASDEISAEGTV